MNSTRERDALTRAIEPLLQLRLALDHSRDSLDAAEAVYQRIVQELDAFSARARDPQLPLAPSDVELAHYAVVALLDEVALSRADALAAFWRPRLLQVRYLNENNAGEGFFERLAGLRGHPKQSHILYLYYICIILGFRGKYRLFDSERELFAIESGVRAELERTGTLAVPGALSPHAARPYEPERQALKRPRALTAAATAALASGLAYISMGLYVSCDTARVLEHIDSLVEGLRNVL